MRRTLNLASSIIHIGSGLLLAGCAPTSLEELAETNQLLSQGLFGESEPNDMPNAATPITTDTVVRATIFQASTDADYFAFQGTAGDKVYAATITSWSAGGVDTTLSLFQPDGTTLIEEDLDDGSFASLSSSIAGATLTQTGMHYLRVISANTSTIRPYDLHVRTRTGSPAGEGEPNDAPPVPLPASRWVRGALSSNADVDAFSIQLNAGDTIFASLDLDPLRDNTPWNGQLLIGPFGGGNTFFLVNDGSMSAQNSEAFPITIKNTGTYTIAVNAPNGVTVVGDYDLSVSIHPATAPTANCTTYTSTDIPKTIPDGPGQVSSTIVIPGNPRIADIDVNLNLNHLAPQDLDITLTSPAGNTNGIVTDVGGAAGTTNTAWDVKFDDEATIPPLYTVLNGLQFQPESAYRLDWFDGENAGGTWTLNLIDDTAVNGGTLNGWSITICEPPADPICVWGDMPQPILSSDFESGPSGFTHQGMQDEWELGNPSLAPVTGCNSGTNCWKTDLDNTYNPGATEELVSAPIDLTKIQAPINLKWAMKYQLDSASYDHSWVQVREVGGANPRRVWESTAATMTTTVGSASTVIQESAGWGIHYADVSAYTGKKIEIVFHLDSDAGGQYAGLAVDDVSVSGCNPCGNGIIDAGEACDDHNQVSGDGCDNNCTMTACGNGVVTMGETCDDGNATNGDGCDNNCTTSACGNGITAGTEACDDGNKVDGDGCDNNCTMTACGNGIVTMGESCDDGNKVDGDGCDTNCTMSACGNGITAGTEACDDGNKLDGDGCDSNCTTSACGNGITAGTEACDDGNKVDGDGCDSNCTKTACGNGILTVPEECDDGNTISGDGCSSDCKTEGMSGSGGGSSSGMGGAGNGGNGGNGGAAGGNGGMGGTAGSNSGGTGGVGGENTGGSAGSGGKIVISGVGGGGYTDSSGSCACAMVGQSETPQSSILALSGIIGMLLSKLRRRRSFASKSGV